MSQTNIISITPGQFPQTFNVSQNDVGRALIVKLADDNGDHDVPAGASVSLAGTKPSGLGFTVAGTVDTNDRSKITFTTTAEMTDESGRFPVEIKLVNGAGFKIGTANAYLDVEADPHPEGTPDGQREQLVNEITALVLRVEAAVERAGILNEAEAWAVGSRDGQPVSAEDETYQNNAKYYNDLAGSSAETAVEAMEEAVAIATGSFSSIGNVVLSVLPSGQVRETWTEE